MARIPKDRKEAEDFVSRALEPWRLALLCNDNGAPRACLANAILALRGHPKWEGILSFDTLHQRTMLRGTAPWLDRHEDRPWTPTDDGFAADWLQHEGIMLPSKAIAEAVELVAHDQQFHPVIDYLTRLQWDGEPRADEWAIRCLGAEDTPFVRAVSSRWLISAIARVMQPGCKVDCALIIEGEQGIGKSQALKILFNPWFTDELAELGSKDAAIQLAGAWCVELAELVGMRRADIDRVKAFITRTHDRYRPPYGIRTIEQPRQCVFAGTVNDSEYLRDETGGRRFWPLEATCINLDMLASQRDQLWAEARDRYAAGEVWWLDGKDLTTTALEQQEERRLRDPWQPTIEAFLLSIPKRPLTSDPNDIAHTVSIPDILHSLFEIPIGEQTQLHANRAAACLKALGWQRFRKKQKGSLSWRYRRSEAATSD